MGVQFVFLHVFDDRFRQSVRLVIIGSLYGCSTSFFHGMASEVWTEVWRHVRVSIHDACGYRTLGPLGLYVFRVWLAAGEGRSSRILTCL